MEKETLVLVRNAYAYDFGGAERFPIFLAESISDRYEPVIISRSKKLLRFAKAHQMKTIQGWWWSNQNWSGWRMLLFPIYALWQFILTFWYFQVFLRLRPSVIHIQSKDDFIGATIAGRLVGARIIWTDHADLKHVWLNTDKPFRNLIGKMVLWAASFADAITVVSNSEKQLVSAHIGSKNEYIKQKITVIYNGVHDHRSEFTDHKNRSEIVFCVASRLVTDKGIAEVIEAFTNVQRRYPDCRLVIMGNGPEAKRFKDMAKAAPRISFLGHVDQPLEIMVNSDIFVHPTYHEGFSVALIEASMMGMPIITTDVGGNLEIITSGKTGLLVQPRDTNTLEDAMEKLLTDATLRTSLAKNARAQYLERFEFGAIVSNYFIPLYTEK